MVVMRLMFLAAWLLVCGAAITTIRAAALPPTLPVDIVDPTGYTQVRGANRSALFRIELPTNATYLQHAPLVLHLKASSRFQVGYDYASLLAAETSLTFDFFMSTVTTNATVVAAFSRFADFLWDSFYLKHVPERFVDELRGMEAWWHDHCGGTASDKADKDERRHHHGHHRRPRPNGIGAVNCSAIVYPPHVVSRRFFVVANMPADTPNIISALERELEHGWPAWLKDIVNIVIWVLEHLHHHCDAFGVWGSRTVEGKLFTSRNLDYAADTGINQFKLITVYDIAESSSLVEASKHKQYVSLGFSFGLGALAGMSRRGISVSEMNLDNSDVTFTGLPFPLRLRYVMEEADSLETAMQVWNRTNNTNSFNFLIGSAKDGQAYALETMRHFTAQFPADSPIERSSTYDCGEPPFVDPTCAKWSNQTTGLVRIGFPLPEAVWRTNHGMNPHIMATQEPLFNGTVFRYNMMHDIFVGYKSAGVPIDDHTAVRIVASLGTKATDNYLSCASRKEGPPGGANILSAVYVPAHGVIYVAWEDGQLATWQPAACAPYVRFNMSAWF